MFQFVLTSILLGIGLAMDAFSVSLANGLHEPKMSAGRMSLIAGVFGGFQLVMPLIGWICVHTIVEYFTVFEQFIPWIALILLCWIGIGMIREGREENGQDEPIDKAVGIKGLIVQGIATSIDALSVGFTIAEYNFAMALFSCCIIGVVTFVICVAGLILGKKFGTRFSGKATIMGGIILIAIGLEIFVSHFLG